MELLISLAVFSVGMLAVLPMFLYSSRMMRYQDDKEAAYRMLMTKVEWIDSMEFESVTDANLPDESLDDGEGHAFTITYDVDAGDPLLASPVEAGEDELDYDLTRVTVVVSWLGMNGEEFDVQLAKYRARF